MGYQQGGPLGSGSSWGGMSAHSASVYHRHIAGAQWATIIGELASTGSYVRGGGHGDIAFIAPSDEGSGGYEIGVVGTREEQQSSGGSDVDPSTLGHNFFWSHYIGPWNPKSFNGRWNYDVAPKSRLDNYAKKHDLAYDDAKVSGLGGVLFSTKAINADYDLAYGAFNLTLNRNSVSQSERAQGLVIGTLITIGALPKSFYYMGEANRRYTESNIRSGNWIWNLPH
ncbi:hypothetical protein FAZ19_15810 [Sphingobacterium alkalisoli]|uniref:Uncharacterized protein n=1 Tax=Sphingobacterium alkalisoli TaxID=1874115 RepID=A0A4U0GX54_9SPHI|nr:hypothetical protein [Sphingobacterium alkalisoli]TJY63735.1 hypothetical protein FAZ19_15810 [Sphingobacterium alkalisoli]GGH25213.1 hypothetical protein GCM10011418_33680 [Sphingobacterium alkalisoli]